MADDNSDLANQAIDARRNLEARRAALIDQLRHVPIGRRGSHVAASIEAELRGVDRDITNISRQETFAHQELNRQHAEELRNTAAAHKLAKQAQDIETTRQAGEVFLRGTEIFNKYKPGDPRINVEMGKLRDQYPLGFAAEAAKGHFGKIASFHDKETERIQGKLADTLFKQTGLSPEQFAAATNVRGTNIKLPASGKLSDIPADQIGKLVTEGQKTAGKKGETATYIAADIAGQTHIFPRGLYENLSAHFGQQPTDKVVASFPQPSPDELAQAEGYRSAAQRQGFATGKPLLDFAPVGTAKTGAPTPESQALTTARGKFLEQHPEATFGRGDTAAAQGRALPINFPANLQPTGGAVGTPVTDRLVSEGRVSLTKPNVPAAAQPNVWALGETERQTPSPSTIPTTPQIPVDARTSLAQRALNDPNATEDHKAAARRILGIQ